MNNPELTALSLRGSYTLAYEAAMAARLVGILIQIKEVKGQLPQAATLRFAQKELNEFANERISLALQRKEEFLTTVTQE